MEKYIYIKEQDVPLYNGKFVIIFSNSVDGVKKHIKDFDYDEIYAHSFLTNWNETEGFVGIFNFDTDYNITHGTIAHECLHLTHYVAERRLFVADFLNDEPLAYLLDFFVNEVYKFAEEKGMEIKTKLIK